MIKVLEISGFCAPLEVRREVKATKVNHRAHSLAVKGVAGCFGNNLSADVEQEILVRVAERRCVDVVVLLVAKGRVAVDM